MVCCEHALWKAEHSGSLCTNLLISVIGSIYASSHVWCLCVVCYINSRVFESLNVINCRWCDIIHTLYFSVSGLHSIDRVFIYFLKQHPYKLVSGIATVNNIRHIVRHIYVYILLGLLTIHTYYWDCYIYIYSYVKG